MSGPYPEKLTGRYFAAGGSASEAAELREVNGQLTVTLVSTGEELAVEFGELGDRLANLPRKIYFTDGSVFECTDNDAVDLAFGRERHFFSRLAAAEGSWKLAAIAVFLTVLAIAGIYRLGIPAAANLAAHVTPPSLVRLIDSSSLDSVDRILFNPSALEEARKEELSNLFAELKEAAELDSPSIRLLFRDGGRLGANAVALPGGTIILTDQLEALSKHEDELAGVLAHEIGHVTGRHSLRQIYRALGIAFMVSVILGDTSQLIDEVIAQAALLDTLSYSRQFELDADITSVEIMIKLGRDPLAFIDLIDRVFEDAGLDSEEAGWLSTHPGNENRRGSVEAEIERLER